MSFHLPEIVRIEGTLITVQEDPYDQGERRIDFTLTDGDNTVQVRWFVSTSLPAPDSQISVFGSVESRTGRIWLEAIGSGAVQVAKAEGVNWFGD